MTKPISNLPLSEFRIQNSEFPTPSSPNLKSQIPNPKSGFTLIELLAVVGILAILFSITAYGVNRAMRHSQETATRTRLEVLKSLLSEYETKARFTTFPSQWYPNTTTLTTPTGGEDFWHQIVGASSLNNPGSVADGANLNTPALLNTSLAMQQLLLLPSNGAAFSKLPSNAIVVISGQSVVLDTWNNPIIFVPGTGLAGVNVGGTARTIQAPNNRPFFASAGPDGDFSQGDDNLYSFEQ